MAKHTLIVGNGITGITVARHLRKRTDDAITVVSAETDHPYSRPALMYIFMGHVKYEDTKLYEDWFWEKNRIHTLRDFVTGVDTEAKTADLAATGQVAYDRLLIATGSKPNRFGWPGENLRGVQGFYGYQDLQLLEENSRGVKQAIVVGGGLIGIEVAEMLHSRGIEVTILNRGAGFWDSVLPAANAELISRHIARHHIGLRVNCELKTCLADDSGRVRAATTPDGEEIACQLVVLTAGVTPNKALAESADIECDKGILIDRNFRTSAPDVWAGGDCAEFREPLPGRKPIEQVWYTGKIHGEYIAANLAGDTLEYEPGVWFNSAKFLDIEYQTYGQVAAKSDPAIGTLYWEEGERAIQIDYSERGREVLGVNLFGIRGRHRVWEKWIREKRPIEEVLTRLREMNFDPEFFRAFEPSLVAQWNAENPQHPVALAPKPGFLARLFG